MDAKATMICPAAKVEQARAVQSSARFPCPMSATRNPPATHYLSSGFMPESDLALLEGLCIITTDPAVSWRDAAAASGLYPITQS